MKHLIDDITITPSEAKCLGIAVSGLGLVQKDIYKSINKQILELIESGTDLPWRKPWRDGYKFKGVSYGPQNFVTGNPYRGANAFTMWLYNMKNKSESIYFLSKKQVQDRGGKLLPGATPLLVWAFIKSEKTKFTKEGKEYSEKSQGIISYYVYDLKDTEGVKPIKRKTIETDTEDQKHEVIVAAQTIIDNMPKRPKIDNNGGDRAFYSPAMDKVSMPLQKAFHAKEGYYSVLFHELSHSTGHKSRIGREFGATKGSKLYAFEELIAEISSAYLCGVTNIDYYTLKNSAAYLKGWASKLKSEIASDRTFLFRAILGATKAAKYIIGTTLEKYGEIVTEGKKIATEAKKTEPHHPGKEITPNKAVKANVNAAIDDIIKANPYLKKAGAMALSMLYSANKNNSFPDTDEGLKGQMFKKMEAIDLVEYDDAYQLTENGKQIVEKINARLETLKAKKSGTDLFPELAGLTTSLQFIKRYLDLDKKTIAVEELGTYIKDLQKAIKAGEIKSSDAYADNIRNIQVKLVKAYNANLKRRTIKVNLSDRPMIEQQLQGLGIWSSVIAAATGKAVEILAYKAISKKTTSVDGLGCGCEEKKPLKIEGFAGVMSADKMGEVKYDSFEFNPYYKSILGKPATNFDLCIYGDPGSGKTVFLLKLANYFAETFGPVLYVSTEEYGSATLIDKINRFKTNSTKLFFSPKLIDDKIDLKKYKFIFIDSVNHAKINLEQYKQIREKNPDTVFILILQTTKAGSYRGGKDWPHEVEISMRLFIDGEIGKRMIQVDKDRYTNPRIVKI